MINTIQEIIEIFPEVKDIEFFDIELNFDINNGSSTDDIINELIKDFKEHLNKICKENNISFMRNEDDDIFIPLRKYYATALAIKLGTHNIENDKKYNILKDDIRLGMEKVYYIHSVLPKLINDVYKLFVIDIKNPNLYSFQDGDESYSFDGPMSSNSEFNFMRWQNKIEEAKDPGHMDWLKEPLKRSSKIEEEFNELFADTWLDKYNERIGIIFNRLALDLIQRNRKNTQRIFDITKDII